MAGVDVRCPRCGRKLMEMETGHGTAKCPRCGVLFEFSSAAGRVSAHAVDETAKPERKVRRPRNKRK